MLNIQENLCGEGFILVKTLWTVDSKRRDKGDVSLINKLKHDKIHWMKEKQKDDKGTEKQTFKDC